MSGSWRKGMTFYDLNILLIIRRYLETHFQFVTGLPHNKLNVTVQCAVQHFSGLDATVTNLGPCINRERRQAAQGKPPLPCVEAVSPTITSYFHLADRQNIGQAGFSCALLTFWVVSCSFLSENNNEALGRWVND